MDIIIYADMRIVVQVLKSLGFKIELLNESKLEAKLKDNAGRFHILGTLLDKEKVYLDVHRDSPLHFAFLGVDYAKKTSKNLLRNIRPCSKDRNKGRNNGRNKLV